MNSSRFQEGAHNFSSNACTDEDSNNATPDSGMTPNSPVDGAPQDPSHFDDEGPASENEDGSGAQSRGLSKSSRSSKGSSSSKGEPKEKRKRSRVTPDQLRHLERIFQSERAPIAARRKEISDLLGMNERQTQIWFQNRRAKEKTIQQKQALARQKSAEAGPDTVPGMPGASPPEVDVYQLIHENEPVTLIPCTDLTIGTWRRISTAPGMNDLLAYTCETRKCLSWYIQSSGHAFKMDMPFATITKTNIMRHGPIIAVLTLTVSTAPTFALERVSVSGDKAGIVRSWDSCNDWTEGKQASLCFTHKVQGDFTELNYLVESIQAHNAPPTLPPPPAIRRKPTYDREPLPPLTMEIPAPPMASLTAPPGFSLPSISGRHSLSPMDTQPKRPSYDSSQAPSPSPYSLENSLGLRTPLSASGGMFSPGAGYPHQSQQSHQTHQTQHQQQQQQQPHAPQHSYLSDSGMYTSQGSHNSSINNSNTYSINGQQQQQQQQQQHDMYNQYGAYTAGADSRLSSSNVNNHNLHNNAQAAPHSSVHQHQHQQPHTQTHSHTSHSHNHNQVQQQQQHYGGGSRSLTSSPYPQQGPGHAHAPLSAPAHLDAYTGPRALPNFNSYRESASLSLSISTSTSVSGSVGAGGPGSASASGSVSASTPGARLSPLSMYPTPSHSPPLLTTPYGAAAGDHDAHVAALAGHAHTHHGHGHGGARHFQGADLAAGGVHHGLAGSTGLRPAPSGMPGLMYETDEVFHGRRSI